jgi:shikimate dehydrogenase
VVSQSLQEICCCIGYPVAGNPTQYLMEKAFARAQLDWRFLTLEVPPEDLADAMRGLRAMRFKGAIVAGPHKAAVLEYLDDLTDQARAAGLASGVTRQEDRLVGEDIAGQGFVSALRQVIDPAEKSILLVGGGDVARELAVSLAAAGVGELTLVQPSDEHQADFISRLTALREFPCRYIASENGFMLDDQVEILIQAADGPANDKARWLNTSALRSDVVVADAILRPIETAIVREAAARGCRTVSGFGVAVHQVATALAAWAGVAADVASLHDALEEFLGV